MPTKQREAPARTRKRRRGRPSDLTNGTYERLAKRYLELIAEGIDSPIAVLADELGLPRSTVKRRIDRCREKKYLVGGVGRKAGAVAGPEL